MDSGIRSQLSFSGISSCPKFESNQWKKEKCSGCGLLAIEHKDSAVSDEDVVNLIKLMAVDEANEIWKHPSGAALFLGGFMASTPSFCNKHKITHIVNTAKDLDKFFVGWSQKQLKELEKRQDIYFHKIPWTDSVFQKLGENNSFDQLILGIEFVEKSLKENHNCLIHCAAGRSRSATLTIGYLITKLDKNYDECLKLVQNKRVIVDPNNFFKKQLEDFSRSNEVKELRQKFNSE